MKFKKIKKSFLSVLLVLTMLAGMLPLSAIPASAGTVTTDKFAAAYNWANGLVGVLQIKVKY